MPVNVDVDVDEEGDGDVDVEMDMVSGFVTSIIFGAAFV